MIRNEKGSVTLIVAITILFIFAVLGTNLVFISSKRRAQLEETKILQNAYNIDEEKAYEDALKKISLRNNLPQEYRELEYLEADGTQYFENITLPENYRIVITLELAKKDLMYNIFDEIYINEENQIQVSEETADATFNTKTIIENDCSGDKSIIKLNESNVLTLDKTARTSQSASLLNKSGTQCFYGKVYSLNVYDRQTLINNFIPCYRKSDNKAGLYDTISKEFLEGKGEEFILGPEL